MAIYCLIKLHSVCVEADPQLVKCEKKENSNGMEWNVFINISKWHQFTSSMIYKIKL